MKPDRESTRLPLRAGAMLLLAISVVFLFLGINSCSAGSKESAHDKLAEAGQSAQATATETATTSAPASSPASPSPSIDVSDVPKLCVLNAGTTGGLAKEVSDKLKSAGFAIGTAPGNLSTASIDENTVFYDDGAQEAAEKVAAAVPGGAEASPRPDVFDKCPGEIVVIVVE